HGLVGQNGAGKSSLMKMVCGVYRADGGHVEVDGEQLVFGSPRAAGEKRVTLVAQELSLVPALTVAENILLGHQPATFGLVSGRRRREAAVELIESYGFNLDPDAVVAELPPSAQQRVEILRALAQDARLIVLDEPTSSMSIDDSTRLYEIIRQLATEGTSVVLVSHFLDEVLEVCDVVTVMRDGEVVANAVPAGELTAPRIVAHMIGEEVTGERAVPTPVDRTGTPRLKVSGLTGPKFRDVDLEVHPGEIVALVGLVGAGRTEVLRGIFGADRPTAGSVEVDGRPAGIRRPSDAVAAGIALLTESRKHDGIFPVLSTTTNIAMAQPASYTTVGWIDRRRQQRAADRVAKQVNVQAASLEAAVTALSGGNQQKALLARWLIEPPTLFLIDEPTRGVDVVSIGQIHSLIRQLVAEGMSVVMVTSEFEEALELAHRIYVMRDGRVVDHVHADDADKPRLLAASFGTQAESEAVR
ncbi:MAG: sugar ABC transporter ATP-binding protein, partial [Actinomycetota bacterium]